ncbi:hypothetical protein PS1_029636 [Malus domestica]
MEASKVKSSKSSREIDKVLKPRANLFTFQLLILLEQTNMDALQLIHFLLQTFVDLQYALKFQHLGFKSINDSLEVDHLVISSNQLFILCSRMKLRNDMLKILNLRYVTSDLILYIFMLNLDRVRPSLQVNDLLASSLKLQRSGGRNIRPLQSNELIICHSICHLLSNLAISAL